MNILVTGGTGFIGSHLVERLRRDGHRVRCIAKDRLNIAILASLNAEVMIGDLMNGIGWDAMLDGIDCIFHLAGVTRARHTADYYTGNHLATKRLVDMLIARGYDKRLVYVSSLTVTGPSPDGNPVTEDTPCHPVSEYGKSKHLAEQEILRAGAHMPITIVRPAAVYGPRERDFLEYIKMARHGFAPLVGFGEKRMSMVHVRDLVDGIARAGTLAAGIRQIYLMGGPSITTTADIGHAVSEASGKSIVQIPLPHAIVYAVGAVCETIGWVFGKQTLFNVQKARESTQRAWTCSNAKAQRELGYAPSIELHAGLIDTYRWYVDQGWLEDDRAKHVAHAPAHVAPGTSAR